MSKARSPREEDSTTIGIRAEVGGVVEMFLDEVVDFGRLRLELLDDKVGSIQPLERRDELERRVERVRIIALGVLLLHIK